MSLFLKKNSSLRSGKWTMEEIEYADALIENFRDGTLDDVGTRMSLRSYLAEKLGTHVKRVSKKYEGTSYNGKQCYLPTLTLDSTTVQERRQKLAVLRKKFEASVQEMKAIEVARQEAYELAREAAAQEVAAADAVEAAAARERSTQIAAAAAAAAGVPAYASSGLGYASLAASSSVPSSIPEGMGISPNMAAILRSSSAPNSLASMPNAAVSGTDDSALGQHVWKNATADKKDDPILLRLIQTRGFDVGVGGNAGGLNSLHGSSSTYLGRNLRDSAFSTGGGYYSNVARHPSLPSITTSANGMVGPRGNSPSGVGGSLLGRDTTGMSSMLLPSGIGLLRSPSSAVARAAAGLTTDSSSQAEALYLASLNNRRSNLTHTAGMGRIEESKQGSPLLGNVPTSSLEAEVRRRVQQYQLQRLQGVDPSGRLSGNRQRSDSPSESKRSTPSPDLDPPVAAGSPKRARLN